MQKKNKNLNTQKKSSISQKEMDIDDSVRTAIIYTISDLYAYTVEIREKGKSILIKKEGEIERFENLEDAKKAAFENNAERIYLAFNLVYDEVGEGQSNKNTPRYDYMLIV